MLEDPATQQCVKSDRSHKRQLLGAIFQCEEIQSRDIAASFVDDLKACTMSFLSHLAHLKRALPLIVRTVELVRPIMEAQRNLSAHPFQWQVLKEYAAFAEAERTQKRKCKHANRAVEDAIDEQEDSGIDDFEMLSKLRIEHCNAQQELKQLRHEHSMKFLSFVNQARKYDPLFLLDCVKHSVQDCLSTCDSDTVTRCLAYRKVIESFTCAGLYDNGIVFEDFENVRPLTNEPARTWQPRILIGTLDGNEYILKEYRMHHGRSSTTLLKGQAAAIAGTSIHCSFGAHCSPRNFLNRN
jgi:hypothetical protein